MLEFKNITKAKKDTGLSYLGNTEISSKIKKSTKYSNQKTYILYLAPADMAGYNTCKFATADCKAGCLNTSGRAAMEINSKNDNTIINARVKKTKLLFEQQEFFMQWLVADIKAAKKNAIKNGYGFSVRLNGTSDINWQNILLDNKSIFEIFPDVQFYDYTKDYTKFFNVPKNYHLTFSYTGYNKGRSNLLLKRGFNVAMVFNAKTLPAEYNGFEVINGDLTDYRPNDGNGVIVGLKWKRIADKQAEQEILKSAFVVNLENSNDWLIQHSNVQTKVKELV